MTWSGYEALTLLESGRVDLLLIDDYVPDLHFDDLLKRVGQLPIQPRILVMQAAAPTFDNVHQYAESSRMYPRAGRAPYITLPHISGRFQRHRAGPHSQPTKNPLETEYF